MKDNLIVLIHCICAVILLSSAAYPVYGSDLPTKLINEYSVKKLTAEDGFVSSEIYSIIQDSQGLLWFGTAENGVMRYDGRKVTLFEFDSSSSNGLSHNDAGNLMLDKNGKIWIGTWGGGANLYDTKTGRFENFIHDPKRKNSISSTRIQSLFHDQKGNIWLGSYDRGLNRYLGEDRFEHIKRIDGEQTSLSHNRIWDMEDNDNNSLWVATSFGLNLFDKTTQTFSHFFPEPQNKTPTGANEIRSILKTSLNKVYVGTQQGPFELDLKSGHFTQLKYLNEENLGQVNSMIEDQAGNIWFVTSKGVFRQSKESLQIEQLELEHNNGLRIIFEDNSKTIWVTSEIHGIYKLVPHGKFKSINSPQLIAPNGITVNGNGDLLIVSSSSQLFQWQVSSQQLEMLTVPIFTEANGYFAGVLQERPIIYHDGGKYYWIAQDEGLAKFNRTTQQLELIHYPKTDPNHREFRELRALNIDHHGDLWIGTYKNGVYRYDPNSKVFSHMDESFGLSHPEVSEIFKDKENNIWVGTGDGINLWQESNQRFLSFKYDKSKPQSLLGEIIQDIHQTRNGDIWIATQKGLNLYKPNSDNFEHFNAESGLPTSLIRAIADDEEGNLWLTTNKGISKLNPVSGEVTNFDIHNGLLGSNYYANGLIEGAQETLFTSSQRGIEFFNTSMIDTDVTEFNLVLTGFSKMGQPIVLDTPYSYVTDIELSYLDYIFSFEFSVLDFVAPNENQYAYKLEGYDDNWIDVGNRNTASFTNLDGGSYKFLVKATNSSGKWGEKQLSINLHVAPPPWKTWWAYLIYLSLIVISIFVLIYVRTRFQQQEISRQKQFVVALEEQVSEKTTSLKAQANDLSQALKKAKEATQLKSEFLANMSHEIRTPMNGVIGMLGLLKDSGLTKGQKEKINIASSSANSLLTLINDILDLSKIEAGKLDFEYIDFDLRGLLEKLAESIAFEAQRKGVEVIIDLTDIQCSLIKSDPSRIRQILTNILSNAIKFTDKGEIIIHAKLIASKSESQSILTCKIQDTGIGIPPEKMSLLFGAFNQVDASTTRKYGGTGLGLSITKKLCELLNGGVTVSSEVGTGSCFEITCLVEDSSSSKTITLPVEYQHLRLLIVDCNKTQRLALRRQYECWGIFVEEAKSSDEALHLCKQSIDKGISKAFDIVIIDTKITSGGTVLAKQIRENNQFQQMKLVMMTSMDENVNNSYFETIGVNTYFSKPATSKDLFSALAVVKQDSNKPISEEGLVCKNTLSQCDGDESQNSWPLNTRVLLVEDNKINQMVALKVLKRIGLTADVANNGLEAINILKEIELNRPYTIIIMDCQMPEMDGYEATRIIRAGKAGEHNLSIPIIAMTANAMQGDREKCLDAGMSDYLTKPIEPTSVQEKLTMWINQVS